MTCRCSSSEEHARRQLEKIRSDLRNENNQKENLIKELASKVKAFEARTDCSNFNILEVHEGTSGICMVLQYKHHKSITKQVNCTFEGKKILVFTGRSLKEAIKWRYIDPHFTNDPPEDEFHAPSPDGRFPATSSGLNDALKMLELAP
jgi:hypothetical protein